MKNFTTFLSKSSQYNKKKVEEFLVAIANGSNDFEWQTVDHESDVTLTGEGDFFACVRKAKAQQMLAQYVLKVRISVMILFFSMIQRRRNGHCTNLIKRIF